MFGSKKAIQIQIYGTSCSNSKKLLELAGKALKDMRLRANIEYISDIEKILPLGMIQLPAMAINQKVVLAGCVPSINGLKDIINKYIS